jgi:cellulose synthase/poly-beta-1,6-N-acetylglucosamine synthase-like glycosyltransferase
MIATVLLATAAAVAIYIIAGYPISLVLFPGRSAPPVRKDPAFRARVSVILAVYNGEAFIRRKLEALLGVNYPPELIEILVVSDGSTDATDRIVESFADRGVRLFRVPRGGKAPALNKAMAHAAGDILFFTDVRQTFHPEVLAHLVANFADPTVGVVSGELRILNPDRTGQSPLGPTCMEIMV